MKTHVIRTIFLIVSITAIIIGLCLAITFIVLGEFPTWGIVTILGGVVIGIIGIRQIRKTQIALS